MNLPEGTAFSVYAASPADVAFTAGASGGRAELDIRTVSGSRSVDIEAGRDEAVTFAVAPELSERLFRVTAVKGHAILGAFRILAHETHRPAYRVDDGIPASLDEPAEGAQVTLPFRARGWCQERGGGRVDPVEFRLDGLLVADSDVTRTSRPDLLGVLPEIGDVCIAGWEAVLSPRVRSGRHVLAVTFQAGDRRRVYPPRAIEISAPDGPAR